MGACPDKVRIDGGGGSNYEGYGRDWRRQNGRG